jgi:hypothetical protein
VLVDRSRILLFLCIASVYNSFVFFTTVFKSIVSSYSTGNGVGKDRKENRTMVSYGEIECSNTSAKCRNPIHRLSLSNPF